MAKEHWRPVIGFEGHYEVSNVGRVRGMDRMKQHPIVGAYKIVGKILSPCDREGYRRLTLYRNGRSRVATVHQLVLESFVGPRPAGAVANHKNRKRHDNRVENLEWVTVQENTLHGFRTGRIGNGARGELSGSAKLTWDNVDMAKRLRADGMYYKDIGKLFGVGWLSIRNAVLGKTWKDRFRPTRQSAEGAGKGQGAATP